jgi:hypothetical protein
VEGSDVEVRVKEKEAKWFEDTVVKNLDGNMTVGYVGLGAGHNEVISWTSGRLRRAGSDFGQS